MKVANDDFRKLEDLADGSSVYEIGDFPEETVQAPQPTLNLAVGFPEDGLKRLSQDLLNDIEKDIKERKAARDFIKTVEPFLGFGLENKSDQYFRKHASKTFDSTLPTAVIRYVSIACREILGREDLTDYKINGEKTPELEEKAEIIKQYFNYFLTRIDRPYRDDFKRCFMYNCFDGSAYKKVYYDELLRQPKARFIVPDDFLIDMNCTSILESNRLTHVLKLSKRDILLRQKSGIYRDVELPYLKTLDDSDDNESGSNSPDNTTLTNKPADSDQTSKDPRFIQYEIHTYVDLSEYKSEIDLSNGEVKNIPLPYVITIDKFTKEVLSIYANFDENEIKPKEEFFVKYTYINGFGVDGLGLAQIIGTNSIAMTKIQNRLIDAATLQNLPAGFRQQGSIKGQSNDLDLSPGQFLEINTNGIPLKDFFMPLPFNGPSPVLRELKLDILTATKELASISQLGMLDSKEDIAPTSMLMAFEHSNVIQSAVLKSLYESFSYELSLLYKIFRRTIGTITFNTKDGIKQISGEDFVDEIEIVPACDPSVNSNIQRMIRANTAMANASSMPDYYNMREVLRLNYEAQGFDKEIIERILKPEPQEQEIMPTDPITEVEHIMLGKPVKPFIWQNQPAYIIVLGAAAQRPEIQSNPQIMASLQADITERQAYQYIIEMQQLLGIELPPLDQMQDSQTQNAIALAAAQALEASGLTLPQTAQGGGEDPNIMAEIQQKQAETEAKLQMASEKNALEAMKTEINLEIEKLKAQSAEYLAMEKIASAERLGALKAELELVKAEAEKNTADLKAQIEFITKQGVKQNDYYEKNESRSS